MKLKFTGISTPFFGLSWENINDTDKLQQYLREMYLLRNKLAYFVFLYDNLYSSLQMNDLDEEDIPLAIVEKINWKVFDTFDEIEGFIFDSNYLFALNKAERKEILEQFDEIKLYRAEMDSNEDETVEYEELVILNLRLVSIFDKVESEIEKLELRVKEILK